MPARPLRVGIFATPVGSNGGIARWISETAQLLVQVDIGTELLIGRQPSVHLNDPTLDASSFAVTRRAYGTQVARLRAWLASTDLDALITALPQAALIAALARPSLPVIATVHGHPPAGVRGSIYSATLRHLAEGGTTQVVTVADRLSALWQLSRSTTVANALARPPQPGRTQPGRTQPGRKQPRTVAYVGRLEPEKGIDRLLDLVAQNPRFAFHVAGDGSLRPAVESMARHEANLHYHGWIQDIPRFLSPMESVVFTAPSEGMPYALLESLWANCLPLIRSIDLASELGLDDDTILGDRSLLAAVVDQLHSIDLEMLRKPFSADQASASWATLITSVVRGQR